MNREYYLQQVDRELAQTDGTVAAGALGKIPSHKHEQLMRLARTTPYYKRNRPHICSFWVKGECKRGEECPYRHERPSDPDDPLSDQNIKDRYYGVNDPVADKILRRAETLPSLTPPEDPHITTLYVGGLDESFAEADMRDYFYQFGEIRSVSMVPKQGCAFVQFTRRSAAEAAADKAFNNLTIRGKRLVIRWGKSQGKQATAGDGAAAAAGGALPPVPGLPAGALPAPPEELRSNFFNLPSSGPSAALAAGASNPYFFPVGAPAAAAAAGAAPSASASSSSSSAAGPSSAPPPPPPLQPPGLSIHYPSQDPSRLGSTHPTLQQPQQ